MLTKKWKENWISRWGHPTGIVVFIFLFIFAAHLSIKFLDYSNNVEHTQQVLSKLDSVSLILERAESGYRAYLLTDDGRYLRRYHMASGSIWKELDHLKALLKENKQQSEKVQLLIDSVTKLYAERDEILKQQRQIKREALIEKFIQASLKQIRDTTTEIEMEENRLLIKRKQDSDFLMMSGLLVMLLGGVVSLLLMHLSRRALKEMSGENFTQNLLLHSILENLEEGLAIVDMDGKNVHTNKSMNSLFGIDLEKVNLENALVWFIYREPNSHRIFEVQDLPLAKALRGETVSDMEILVQKRSDPSREVILNCSSRPILDYEKKVIGAMCVYRDVTQRLQLESELKKARNAAMETAQLKSDFLTQMGHEIRTPMNGVLGLSNTLLSTKLDPEQVKLVKSVRTSAQHLLNLILNILDQSLIEKNKLILEPSKVRFHDLLQDIFDLGNNLALNRKVRFYIDSELPLQFAIFADGIRLQQVCLNLIEKAVQRTKSGFVSLKVEVLEYYDHKTRIYFEIKATDQSGAEASTLADELSSRIVQLMGGEIEFQRQSDFGSRTWFTLDFDYISSESKAELEARFQEDKPVLVAEDQAINQIVIKKYLDKLGLNSVTVADGQAAFEQARQGDYCAVLMDCKMHPVDGYQATELIRTAEKSTGTRVPIIALTADGSPEDRKRCQDVGMDDYLVKPVDLEKLEFHLRKWLRPLVKEGTLQKLLGFEMDGQTLLQSLAGEYFKIGPEHLASLEAAFIQRDINKVKYYAHTLKSASIMLGLVDLSYQCERLETAQELDDQSVQHLQILKNSFSKSQKALRESLSRYSLTV